MRMPGRSRAPRHWRRATYRPVRRPRTFATADLIRAWFSGLRASPYNFLATPKRTAVLMSFMFARTASAWKHAVHRPFAERRLPGCVDDLRMPRRMRGGGIGSKDGV